MKRATEKWWAWPRGHALDPAPKQRTRWGRARMTSGLAALDRQTLTLRTHRGRRVRRLSNVPGTAEAAGHLWRIKHAVIELGIADHFELVIYGETRRRFDLWSTTEIADRLRGHRGQMLLYLNGRVIWLGPAPQPRWTAQEWRLFVYGEVQW